VHDFELRTSIKKAKDSAMAGDGSATSGAAAAVATALALALTVAATLLAVTAWLQ
jgi:hypothetical protein